MQSKIIAVDLAKDVFEIAVANHQFRILERHRLSPNPVRQIPPPTSTGPDAFRNLRYRTLLGP